MHYKKENDDLLTHAVPMEEKKGQSTIDDRLKVSLSVKIWDKSKHLNWHSCNFDFLTKAILIRVLSV